MQSAPSLSNKFATWPHTLLQPGGEIMTGLPTPIAKSPPIATSQFPVNRVVRFLGPALYDGKPKPKED